MSCYKNNYYRKFWNKVATAEGAKNMTDRQIAQEIESTKLLSEEYNNHIPDDVYFSDLNVPYKQIQLAKRVDNLQKNLDSRGDIWENEFTPHGGLKSRKTLR
jgi:hypothetical protein